MGQTQIPDDERLVGLAGDWHGATRWGIAVVKALNAAGVRTLFHLGDFGFWPGHTEFSYVQRLEVACAENNVTIYVTPGNHEDWDILKDLFEQGPGPRQITTHIFALPPGWRWTVRKRSFVSLGGAPSIDFEYRTAGEDWWPAEAVSDTDVDRVIAGGHADVMLAHDAPNNATLAVQKIVSVNPIGISPAARAYAAQGRAQMTRAFAAVQPKLYAHGHYHVYDEVSRAANRTTGTWQHHILSLEHELRPGNSAILDVDRLRTTLLKVRM
ncbi:metallophosphoesterase [Cryobacterium sp. N19]|uniref:metallophosphoesterase n=1 Tax=Cryobacterium sp. N19 TaxID=2048288 RepID=UPI000CE487A9|nr:metallophosphoesterase [Cryobacterium sp. N19]